MTVTPSASIPGVVRPDRWVSSPFQSRLDDSHACGCALQANIIRSPAKGAIAINMEDGLVLADAALRSELARRLPRTVRSVPGAATLHDPGALAIGLVLTPARKLSGVYFPCLLDTRLTVLPSE